MLAAVSGRDDNKGGPRPPEPATEMAPAFASDLALPGHIDPWTELTPGDPSELVSLVEEESPPLPGFVPEGVIEAAEVTGAEVEALAFAVPEPEPHWPDAQGLGPVAPPEWAEAELEPEPDPYAGDGPFASPMDAPAARGPSRFEEALRWQPSAEMLQAGLPAEPEALVPARVKAELEKPHRLQRRTPSGAPRTVAAAQRAVKPSAPAAPTGTPRHYPKMRALLKDPDAVPYGIDPPTPAASPPVPGTFFPTVRVQKPRPEAVDLDGLLLTMAEGLLIGEGPKGGTEVRVTLKDEFFAGTELRIAVGDGAVRAVLVPPDREIYWQLNGHIDDLEARLCGKGLKVRSIEVLEPGA